MPLLLALGSGVLYAALFPPYAAGWLAWGVLVPLLVAAQRSGVAWAALCGAAWAVAASFGIAWWFPGMLEGFFALSREASWLSLLGAALVINAPPYAAFAAFVSWRARFGPVPAWLVAAAWVVAEFARAHGALANPVGLLAYSQVSTPLAQLADLAGPYGIGALLAAGNAVLASALLRGPRHALRPAVGVAAAVVLSLGYGALRLDTQFGEERGVRVAVVQGGVVREPHWDRTRRTEYLERYLDLTRTSATYRPAIVFWPEFAVDFYLVEDTPNRARLLETVRTLDADLLTGAAHYRFGSGRTHYYNSVFLVDRAGRVVDRYDKTRLVPFAEYGPLGDWLRSDTAVYESGGTARLLAAGGMRIGAFICGEAVFPEVARALSSAGAEVLANPSNDYWFGHPSAQEHQLSMAALRAIENRRYLVRPTATGVSAVVDPHGRAVTRTNGSTGEVLEAVIRPSRAVTLYQRVGDSFVGLALALAIFGAGTALRAERPAPGGEA